MDNLDSANLQNRAFQYIAFKRRMAYCTHRNGIDIKHVVYK